MTRRQWFKTTSLLVAGVAGAVAAGCAPWIAAVARDPKNGQPWQCGNCGRITRSGKDLSAHRCPRCWHKGRFRRITEEKILGLIKKHG